MVAEMACCTVATAAKRAARRSSSATSSVVNELHRDGTRDHTGPDSFVEEESDRFSAAITIIECPVVDVHADELVRFAAIEPSREAHGVVERALPVLEPECDALAQVSRHFCPQLARHVFADHVAAQWQRHPGLVFPPGAHVGNEMQTLVPVGELPFVDE